MKRREHINGITFLVNFANYSVHFINVHRRIKKKIHYKNANVMFIQVEIIDMMHSYTA